MTLTDNLEGFGMLCNTEVVTCGGRLCGVHVMIIFGKGTNCQFYFNLFYGPLLSGNCQHQLL